MLALERAAAGSPRSKVTVNRAWLREVHRKLLAGARAEAELAAAKRNETIIESIFGACPAR